MADEPGSFTLGFSVTPDELTVVTDQGHTVTLIDTGVELVDSYRTIVARATNGEKYPIVVNESQSGAAIGANWQHDEGGNPNAEGLDYVKIIDNQGAYVNVQLINWLMQFGASFRVTFNDVYIKNGTVNEESGLVNYSCHLGDIMQINSSSETRTSFIYDDADGHLINCAGDGYSDTTHLPGDFKVSKNPSDTVAYNNYWVLKALGVPLSVVEEDTNNPMFVQIREIPGDDSFAGLGFRNENGELSICVDNHGNYIQFDGDTLIILAYPGNCGTNPSGTGTSIESGLRTIPVGIVWDSCDLVGNPSIVKGQAKISLEYNSELHEIILDEVSVFDESGEELNARYDYDGTTELETYDYVV